MLTSLPVAIISLFAMMGAVQADPTGAPGAPFVRSAPHIRRDVCFYGTGQCCDSVPISGATGSEALQIYETVSGDDSRSVAPPELSGKNCVSNSNWPTCGSGKTPLCCGGAASDKAHSCVDSSSQAWL